MGENIIYNFDYFVRMGLLDKTLINEVLSITEIPLNGETG
jgi:hypothetical protein